MNKIMFSLSTLTASAAIIISVSSCNNGGKDAKDTADSANNAKAKTTDSSTRATTDKIADASGAMKRNFKDDAHFVTDALDGGLFEIESSKLALKTSSDERVKSFATMMIKDHTKWGDQMKALAKVKNITFPTELSDGRKDDLKKLSEKEKGKFDLAYLDAMKSDHKDDLDLFQDARKNTKDADLGAAIDKVIPGIQHHSVEANKLDSTLSKQK